MQVNLAGEGLLDIAVMRRLLRDAGLSPGTIYHGEGRRTGKVSLNHRLPGYCEAAKRAPWFIMRDLDHDADCAPELLNRLAAERPRGLCFRIAVREAESWLIADRERLARHLGVRPGSLPSDPDRDPDPKRTIVDAARRSTRRTIRERVPPRPAAGRPTGEGYAESLAAFIDDTWRPTEARVASDSLDRCLRHLDRFAATLRR